ncbi:MAG: alpha/beta hydrolase [Chloroflexi bacterium]|nr:alpha/beta hydrolase [Chloroflexota bacterium]
MPFAETATGARLYYDDVGQGEVVVVLHGRLGTARDQLGSVMDWLSKTYRVIGPTLRGYGQSEPKPRRFPPDFYARDAADILALLDTLRIEKAHLLGYSDGGEVALIAAGQQPGRFRSAAVWGAVGYFGPEMRPYVQRSYPPTWISAHDCEQHGISDPQVFALEWINAMKSMIDRGGDVSLSLAPKIVCPLLLMLGAEDKLNPEAYGRKLVAAAPRGKLKMFACGHAVHEERWPEFQKTLGAFLRGAR